MYIKNLELYNFRIYKGLNRISLEPHSDKNIIVVSGLNGFGKTTFLMSLVWCLYGKTMQKVDAIYDKEISDKGSYPKYIANCLNRKARSEGETKFYVKVTIADVKICDISCEVEITRSYDTQKDEYLDIRLANDGLQQMINFSEKNTSEIFIRDFIMPDAIAKFFFFDAEKITSLADVTRKEHSQNLSMAYSEVLGIKKYEDLKKDLETKLDTYRKNSAKEEDKKKLNNNSHSIKDVELDIETLTNHIEQLREEISPRRKEIEDITTKLIKEGATKSTEEIASLRSTAESLQQEKQKQQDNLKNLYNYVPFAIAGEHLKLINEQVEKERTLTDQKFRHQDVEEKIRKIRQDIEDGKKVVPFSIDINTQDYYNKQIEQLIKKYFYHTSTDLDENMTTLHAFSENQERELKQLIDTVKSCRRQFTEIHRQYTKAKQEYERICREMREAERMGESEIIADLRQKRDLFNDEISQKEQEIGASTQRIEQQKETLKKLRQEQASIRKQIDDAADYTRKEKKVVELVGILNEFIGQFKQQKKELLEEKMLKTLQQLLHKQNFVQKVEVDILSSECIDIKLYKEDGNNIDLAGLSMGERQLYASSLLSSLVAESGIDFPVFIDSPMQKLDKDHSDNIVKYFYPSISKQVVIFPLLNTELRRDNYDLMKDNICRTILIDNVTPDHSRFIEIEPSQLFKNAK